MTYVNPAGLAPSPGYSHAVVRPGTPVFLTGQIALDENGKLVGPGDIAAQVAQVWANIRTLCEGLGCSLGDIVKLTTYTTSRAYLEAIGAERRRHFEPGAFPASTFLVVSELASPDYLVEIEAIVVLPEAQ
jgi:2-iminobutanoate/2-iminopropanoate deaminase